jgi:surfeit locus 1 family protein
MSGVALAFLLSLGTWQLQRKAWKEQLIATVAARATASPITNATWDTTTCPSGPTITFESDVCDFRPVALEGTLRSDGERHVFISIPRQASGVGGAGYWIFTPFTLAPPASGEIYLNRGFVPEAQKATAARPTGQVEGAQRITGVLRRTEPRQRFSNPNDPVKNVYYVRDPREFGGLAAAAYRGPSPLDYYVDQIGPVPPGNLPLPIAGKLDIPNRHLEYALTWYGLAVTLVVLFAVFSRSRLKA